MNSSLKIFVIFSKVFRLLNYMVGEYWDSSFVFNTSLNFNSSQLLKTHVFFFKLIHSMYFWLSMFWVRNFYFSFLHFRCLSFLSCLSILKNWSMSTIMIENKWSKRLILITLNQMNSFELFDRTKLIEWIGWDSVLISFKLKKYKNIIYELILILWPLTKIKWSQLQNIYGKKIKCNDFTIMVMKWYHSYGYWRDVI